MYSPFSPPLPSGSKQTCYWGPQHGSAYALALTQWSRETSDPIVVITPDTASAQRLESDLGFYGADLETALFPDWETLPYDSFSPHQDIVSARLKLLNRVQRGFNGIVIVAINTLMQRLPPVDFVAIQAMTLATGDRLERERFRQSLHRAGYRAVETVFEPGEYAFRGALIDLYPVGGDHPVRIDLFDDDVDSLRTFDPDTQRTIDKIERLSLLPAHEYPLTEEGIARFREGFETRFDVDPRQCPVYVDALKGIAAPGLEQYLPLFFETTSTLLDHLPEGASIALYQHTFEAAETHWRSIEARFDNLGVDSTRPLLPPATAFVPVAELFGQFNTRPRVQWVEADHPHAHLFETHALPDVAIDGRSTKPLSRIEQVLADHPGQRLLLVAESRGRQEVLQDTLAPLGLDVPDLDHWQAFLDSTHTVAMTHGAVEAGLWVGTPPDMLVLTETELYGDIVRQSRRREKTTDDSEMAVRHLSELKEGAPVVHQQHGVGRYLGLETLSTGGQQAEFLTLKFADDARLYVPVDHLHLISRYAGASDEHAPLHKLGSEQWTKARKKAAEKIRDTAAELLDVYARREAREGFACPAPDDDYARFSANFAFEETPDQRNAIEAVINDMTAKQPMDRVVCGDVGFGKTEVAMRAAFLAVHSGRQVAVLVPTTLLAQQHFDTFINRFADTAIQIELISRFNAGKAQKAAFERIANGQADIVIGTHRLLSKELSFDNLGLVIVDEEHRFGVSQKERLKQLRAEVDILTLTATPIPRTLSMAMSGMRDLSIIATPPAKRLSVKTFVQQRNEGVLKEAILRELLRGGQVYYLHNDVKTIDATGETLQELIPEARIGIAHGQMAERQLERVMSDFYHKRANILVCSTIIETGIDVPSANTIIIERADKFGLAQLHQLRGRVGRSHHQAYAYLLTPPPRQMTSDAKKRLDAIAQAEDLGAGFTLASHDLEIRGAGELLGDEQSGQIETIGYTLYMDMLDSAVKAIKAGKTPNIEAPLNEGVDINLNVQALLPQDYIRDVSQRLIMYKRISNAANEGELKELQVELVDRFGLLPEPVKNLFRQAQLRQRADRLGIVKIDAGDKGGRVQFSEQTAVDPMTLVNLIQSNPLIYKFDGASLLRFEQDLATAEARFKAVESLLGHLNQKTAETA
ncbi:transcription-repair coupling factor [Larsenimonas salina]|uniref:transcription-repair coupling factor n=1 Tax=Larsenimonas salina TaxID=1295565 RepID=UPI002072B008|nr:transcription-repair coupling factor [Larsenimonas salina]MCM5703193.1 transcription-repair coupling factor [Larsenimonas salina]